MNCPKDGNSDDYGFRVCEDGFITDRYGNEIGECEDCQEQGEDND